jgi:predicted short-subunit dehydrogenase-like oxidoreductase (DUF2520 family)
MRPDLDALPIALVGAGAVGRALALALQSAGLPVEAVLSRSAASAQRVAREAGIPFASDEMDLPPGVRFVLICTPDGAVSKVAGELARRDHPWAETWVGHTSGALSADVLQAVRARGARVFGFHPLQTLTRTSDPSVLKGAVAGIEDDARGVARALAVRLGMRPFPLQAQHKPRYHLAASLASNGLVALVGVVADVLESLGLDREEATGVMAPLLQGTLANLERGTPETALTGPVARGDIETIRRHLDALQGPLADRREVYRAIQREALRIAERSRVLENDRAEALRNALGEGD